MGPKKNRDGANSSQVLHKVAKKPGRGVRLPSQARHIVENGRKFFEKEKHCRSTIDRMAVTKRTAEARYLCENCTRDSQAICSP